MLGDPAGTGDTSPPYGWMCLGRYGGTNDTCSVPTARVEPNEIFAGQNELETKVKEAGPLRGKLTVHDPTIDSDNPTHGWDMRTAALGMGIPEENLTIIGSSFHDFFTKEKWKSLREETLVMAFPNTWAADLWSDTPAIVAEQNVLFVGGAINTDTKGYNRRDFWYPDHPQWEGNDQWERAFANFATGKVILAKYVDRPDSTGQVTAYRGNVKCGLAKEFCYSVLRFDWQTGSSSASVRLGALAFYLFQLWDTPQEVVGVLNTCAEDVGEPGIDEEFGRGVVSVVCDTVQGRERSAVANSLNMSNVSPVLSQMTRSGESRQLVPQSLSTKSVTEWFKPFYAVRGHDLETVTGHLGGQFSLWGTDLFVFGGADYSPLGVRSSLLHSVRSPFMEFGSRRTLFSRDGHAASLLGAYGYSEGGGLAAHVAHLGTRYQQQLGAAILALNAGYQVVQGHLGIPGYRQAGATPVPFTKGNPEVRFSFILTR